ncbi:SDR family NAD(P)-dependent oxidoreductase [Actinomadura rudentiformis]|uniref:SDR family oxidoreductase n=1 Tax=Actinomadura rudentiformis TaxID=359158 RepID=A0A6H9YJF0_9ACTN|nr:SDR family oxidoreductase [Actinomadura rudentiformis]KAB2345562.1 SDR family oxidoreductase [Actinomadura rudentiformis]
MTPPSRRSVLATGAGVLGLGMVSAPNAAAEARGRRFEGKTVLLTGGTSGIGKATVYALAREGARVFFCGRRAALGRQNEREIRAAGGEATFHRTDVGIESEVSTLVAACVKRYGGIDIAVNNAGIETPKAAPLHEQSAEDFDAVWRTNARGVFLCMKHELPHMLRRGRGVIVNTASISAEVGFATIAPYNASKHAVASLTKVAALEYAAKNIRINALAPGAVDTPMLERAAKAFGMTYEQIAQGYPIKRIVRAEEMARVIMWLASDEASPVVGTDLDASGGYLTG